MRRWLFDAVAVAGPHRDAPLGLEAGEQPGRVPHRDVGPAVLALSGRRHLAAGQVGHELHAVARSEEHTSELQSRLHLVCRLLLEKKKNHTADENTTSIRPATYDCQGGVA